MYNWKGLMLPDGDVRIRETMEAEGKPLFDGKPTYQFRKFDAAIKCVKQRRHAVDVGAHVGLWSRVLVKHFDAVTAFEPIQDYRDCFAVNMSNAGAQNVIMHPVALGNESGQVELKVKASNSGVTHIVNEKGPDTQTAELRTLDSFNLVDVDFLKIDCEGYEWFVVMGGEQTIRRDKPVIIVEQKPSTKDRYGLKFQKAVRLLEKWGAKQVHEIGGDHIMRW